MRASNIPSVQSHLQVLKRIAHDAFDIRHRLTILKQRTTDLLLWGYAIDKQHRVMAWLGPAYNSSSDPFAPEIRHWKPGALMHTVPLPGIHFFDAWRIRPSLRPDPLMGAPLPSMGKEEFIPQEPPNADYGQNDRADVQHRREQERDARVSSKTMARLALEMSHVHRLAALVTDKAELLKALAIQRQSYQDELKEASKGKSTAKAAAPKKQKTTDATDSLTQKPIPEPTAHGSQAMEVDQSNLTPQSTGTPFPYPFTSAPQYGRTASSSSRPLPPPAPNPPAHPQDQASETVSRGVQQASPTIPREFCDEILSVLSNLPDEWPLIKIDMILSKVESFYVSWRRFLYFNERLRTLDPRPAARTFSKNKDRILAHLVQVISEWIVSSIEPAKEMTRSKEPPKIFGSAQYGSICTRL